MSNAVILFGAVIALASSQQQSYPSQLDVDKVYPKYTNYVDLSKYGLDGSKTTTTTTSNGLDGDSFGSCRCRNEIARIDNKLENVLDYLQQQSKKTSNSDMYYQAPPAVIADYASAYKAQGYGGNEEGYNSFAGYVGEKGKKSGGDSGGGYGAYKKSRNDERFDKAAYQGFSAENNNDGYSKKVGYTGANEHGDAQAAEEKYTKNENYNNGVFETEDVARFEAGAQDNQALSAKVRKKSQNRIDFEQNLADDFNHEQHNGNYKGNEFDVKYSARDQQGGYKEHENEREYNAEKSDGFEGKSSLTKQGDYQGSDYLKGSDYSKEGALSIRSNGGGGGGVIDGDGIDGIDGMEKQTRDLYNSYKGRRSGKESKPRDKKQDDNNSLFFNQGRGNARGREEEEYSQDRNEREYGAAFEGNDGMEKSYNNAGYANLQQGDRSKFAYDNGNYRDVQANGHNKHADYQGDYNTVNTEHKTAYGLRDDREYKQDVDTNFEEDRYSETYADASARGTFAKENNQGKYYDREDYSEFDANAHGKAFEADSYSNGRKSNGHIDNTVKRRIEQTKANGQHDDTTHYNKYGNRYGKGYYQR